MPNSEDPSTSHRSPGMKSGGGRVLPTVALVIALVALGLAGWAAFRPAPASTAAAVYSDAEQAAAKTKTCAAVDLVRKGVSLNTNLQAPGGEADVTGSLAVAANARISLSEGGQYLLARVEPAAPQPLAEDVTTFANSLLDIGAASIAGALNTDPDQAARLQAVDGLNTKLVDACR